MNNTTNIYTKLHTIQSKLTHLTKTEEQKKQVAEVLERHKLKDLNSPYGKN